MTIQTEPFKQSLAHEGFVSAGGSCLTPLKERGGAGAPREMGGFLGT